MVFVATVLCCDVKYFIRIIADNLVLTIVLRFTAVSSLKSCGEKRDFTVTAW